MYTGIGAWLGVGGRLLSSRDTAESVEERRAVVDLPSSLALSTSGTLPLLPELVSSDRPLSTPNNLNCPFFSACSGSMRGSCGPRAGPLILPRDKR